MSKNCKKIFAQKSSVNGLYSWCRPVNSYNNKYTNANSNNSGGGESRFCNAVPYSQGQDWYVTYVYDIKVVNGQKEQSAYVECGYVL